MNLNEILIDNLTDGAILASSGIIERVNPPALEYFPDLRPGMQLPEALDVVRKSAELAGEITIRGRKCIFSYYCREERELILLKNSHEASLHDHRLDGAVSKLGDLLDNMYSGLGLLAAELEREHSTAQQRIDLLNRNLYQVIKLVNNIAFLRDDGLRHHPCPIDIVGLCRGVCDEAGTLLESVGVSVVFKSTLTGLLIQGDSNLLQRAILALLSNSAMAIGAGGTVTAELARHDKYVFMTLKNDIAPDRQMSLLSMLSGERIVLAQPEQGAGYGLSVVRKIAELHGGNFFLERKEEDGIKTILTLPIGQPTAHLPVNAPAVEQSAGLSPLLLELSNVLPASFFHIEPLD